MKSINITLQCQSRRPEDIEFLQDWDNERFYYLNGCRLSLETSLSVLNKSPSGFNHGYGGSGPAQLALAICLELYGQQVALQLFQTFKQQYIAPLPEGEFTTSFSVPEPLMGKGNFSDQHCLEARSIDDNTVSVTGEHSFRVGDLVNVDERFNPEKVIGYVYEEYKGSNGQLGISILLANEKDLGGFSLDEQQDYLTFIEHRTPIYQYKNNAQMYRDLREGWFDKVFKGAIAGIRE